MLHLSTIIDYMVKKIWKITALILSKFIALIVTSVIFLVSKKFQGFEKSTQRLPHVGVGLYNERMICSAKIVLQ